MFFHLTFPDGSVKKRIRGDFSSNVFRSDDTQRQVGKKRLKTGRGEFPDRMQGRILVQAGECPTGCAVVGELRLRGGKPVKFFEETPELVLGDSLVGQTPKASELRLSEFINNPRWRGKVGVRWSF